MAYTPFSSLLVSHWSIYSSEDAVLEYQESSFLLLSESPRLTSVGGDGSDGRRVELEFRRPGEQLRPQKVI